MFNVVAHEKKVFVAGTPKENITYVLAITSITVIQLHEFHSEQNSQK